MPQRAQLTRSRGIGSGPSGVPPQLANSISAIDAVTLCQITVVLLIVQLIERRCEGRLGAERADRGPLTL
jgi:hypothetical protein